MLVEIISYTFIGKRTVNKIFAIFRFSNRNINIVPDMFILWTFHCIRMKFEEEKQTFSFFLNGICWKNDGKTQVKHPNNYLNHFTSFHLNNRNFILIAINAINVNYFNCYEFRYSIRWFLQNKTTIVFKWRIEFRTKTLYLFPEINIM